MPRETFSFVQIRSHRDFGIFEKLYKDIYESSGEEALTTLFIMCVQSLCFDYVENASTWEPLWELQKTWMWRFLCHLRGAGGAHTEYAHAVHQLCNAKKRKKKPNTKQTPPPTHIRSVSSSKKQLWGTQTVKSTPSQIKPDCNNETPQLTSLRHNKHCFDMVLNIPFPQARAHTNTAIYCVKPSRRHVTASCSLATCLTQTIGPTWRRGYYRLP